MATPRTITLFIPGRPATKKTGQRIIRVAGRPIIAPSKAYCDYEDWAILNLRRQCKEHFLGKVAIQATWAMPNRASWPDWCGLAQGLGDILEKAGIIENDRLIEHWDGSRIIVDKNNPGVKITISEITPF